MNVVIIMILILCSIGCFEDFELKLPMALKKLRCHKGQSKVYFITWPMQNVTGGATTFIEGIRGGSTPF